MTDALMTILPFLAFMLIPLWIPTIAMITGGALDAIGRLRGASEVAAPAGNRAQYEVAQTL